MARSEVIRLTVEMSGGGVNSAVTVQKHYRVHINLTYYGKLAGFGGNPEKMTEYNANALPFWEGASNSACKLVTAPTIIQ